MSEPTRRRLAFLYRGLFYALASAPVWGIVLALAIVWNRLPL